MSTPHLPAEKAFSYTNLPTEKRLFLIIKLTSAAFLFGIAFSYKLWIPDRVFPLLPIFEAFPIHLPALNYLLLTVLVLLLIGNIFYPKPVLSLFVLPVTGALLLQDQYRLQPWVYIYLLIFLGLGFLSGNPKHKQALLLYLQIIIVGVYAWSGFHKLNPAFPETVFSMILTGLFEINNPEL